MISVLILSPIPALRAGLRALLSADPEISVAGAVGGWDGLPDDLAPETVDVVVTAGGAGLDGLPALAPHAAVLLVSGEGEEVAALLRRVALEGEAGGRGRAWGAVAPDAPGEALQKAVHALAEGLVTLSPNLAEALLAVLVDSAPQFADPEYADPQPAGLLYANPRSAGAGGAATLGPGAGEEGDSTLSPAERLTPREAEVLRQMADGLTNKQIALALGISEHTVKFHVSAIYAKLGAANRAEAVRRGARAGWLPI